MDYHERAVECVEHATQVSDPACKDAFLRLALGWEQLAEQHDRFDLDGAPASRPNDGSPKPTPAPQPR